MTHIHLIGIGGTGISSIARVLLEKGYTVTGSDRILSPLALDLEIHGARVYEGHDAKNIEGANIVVRSSAIPDTNVEVVAARKAGVPVLKRSEFLGTLLNDHIGIAVAGSHGKTTTTALMAFSLNRLELDPSYIIGGVSKDLVGNAHAGQGKYFVIEADEYDRMFMGLNPEIVILTNVEYDHPDIYPTPADYQQAFVDFIKTIKRNGLLIACADFENTPALLSAKPATVRSFTYGLSESADYRAEQLAVNSAGGYDYSVTFRGEPLCMVSLQVPGEHNVRNSLAVLAALHALNLSIDSAARAFSKFTGTGRRFDILGEVGGITVVDDYAHHPSKIRATLSAACSRFPGRRLVAVWQPHTYSRTKTLAADFIRSLATADVTVVTEVYPAREPVEAFSSAELVKKMANKESYYCKTLDDTVAFLEKKLLPGDVLLVLSAGDADQVCKRILQWLRERES
jgi:UDP-N-acetylmuramate--alanine ligase